MKSIKNRENSIGKSNSIGSHAIEFYKNTIRWRENNYVKFFSIRITVGLQFQQEQELNRTKGNCLLVFTNKLGEFPLHITLNENIFFSRKERKSAPSSKRIIRRSKENWVLNQFLENLIWKWRSSRRREEHIFQTAIVLKSFLQGFQELIWSIENMG